jgi:hypothetical protein
MGQKTRYSHQEKANACEVFALPGCYEVCVGNCLLLFWDIILAPSSRVKQSKNNLIPEDKTNRKS